LGERPAQLIQELKALNNYEVFAQRLATRIGDLDAPAYIADAIKFVAASV